MIDVDVYNWPIVMICPSGPIGKMQQIRNDCYSLFLIGPSCEIWTASHFILSIFSCLWGTVDLYFGCDKSWLRPRLRVWVCGWRCSRPPLTQCYQKYFSFWRLHWLSIFLLISIDVWHLELPMSAIPFPQ